MPCAADRRPRRPAARRAAVCLAALSVLAGCSGGNSPAHGGTAAGAAHAGPRRGPAGRFIRLAGGRHVVVLTPAGGGGLVFFNGSTSSGGAGRPRISVPAIPPPDATRPIIMPLEAYEQIVDQQADVLAEASSLLTQRCMAARGFIDTAPAQTSDSLDAIRQIEAGQLGLTSLAQAQEYGYATPRGSLPPGRSSSSPGAPSARRSASTGPPGPARCCGRPADRARAACCSPSRGSTARVPATRCPASRSRPSSGRRASRW